MRRILILIFFGSLLSSLSAAVVDVGYSPGIVTEQACITVPCQTVVPAVLTDVVLTAPLLSPAGIIVRYEMWVTYRVYLLSYHNPDYGLCVSPNVIGYVTSKANRHASTYFARHVFMS